MSKRFGNITTARDLREDGVDAGAIRLLMFQAHYRQRLDLTDDGLAGAREGSKRLGEFQRRLLAARSGADAPAFVELAERLEREVGEALDDDLNAPRAVAAVFAFAGAGNAAMDAGGSPGPRAIAAWERVEGVLGVTSEVTAISITGSGTLGAAGGNPGSDGSMRSRSRHRAAPMSRASATGRPDGRFAAKRPRRAGFRRGGPDPGPAQGRRVGGSRWAGRIGGGGARREVAQPIDASQVGIYDMGLCVFRPVVG